MAKLPRASHGEVTAGLSLVHAGTMTLPIRYELAGEANDPLLVVAGGISAGRHVLANQSKPSHGWWQIQAHSFAKHRVLSIDWIGADGEVDLPIDPSDQAQAILAVLDSLGIGKVSAFVGASYGGMVGMHFSAMASQRVGSLLSISAAHRSHPYSSALRALQRQAIELGEQSGKAAAGVALARKLAVLSYRTPDEFAKRFVRELVIEAGRATAAAEAYLNHMGERHGERVRSAAYRRLSESIDLHSIDPKRIATPSIFVAVESDQLVPSADIEALAQAAQSGRFLTIPSLYGHDAFLKEERAIAGILDRFLNSLEQQQ
jgi:homoserine O-acetyltransferase